MRPIEPVSIVLTGQEVIDAASEYPPMIVAMCYDSAEILAGVYSELRIAEGTRSADWPDISVPRRVEHGWCVRREDGFIIDSVFAQEIAHEQVDPQTIQVTYIEHAVLLQSRPVGQLRDAIRTRAMAARPPLVSRRRRWRFTEQQRDAFVVAARKA
jgi:hypothetical protein